MICTIGDSLIVDSTSIKKKVTSTTLIFNNYMLRIGKNQPIKSYYIGADGQIIVASNGKKECFRCCIDRMYIDLRQRLKI